MSVIHITANGDASQVLQLVRSAIDGEIARLELGLQLAQKRLLPFEEKYAVTSERFIAEMTAEDLTGGDDEYVRWAGEYRLMERLQAKLQKLQGLLNIRIDLKQFEEKYQQSTVDFYRQFAQGQADDGEDALLWAGLYEMSQDDERRLQNLVCRIDG